MIKFTKGDKVKIRSNLIKMKLYGDKFAICIPKELMGVVGIVLEADFTDHSCKIIFPGDRKAWMPFEVITHIKKKKQFNGLEVD